MNKNKNQTETWSVQENVMADGINHLAVMSTATDGWGESLMVCSVTPMKWKRPIDMANASLIASAPELLEALQGLVRQYHHDEITSFEAALSLAESAIAKATQPPSPSTPGQEA